MTDDDIDPSALDNALAIARELEARGVSYAIGGALAIGVWSNPRATNDVDLNVFVDDTQLDVVFEALESAGAVFDREQARRASSNDGMFIAHLHHMRIDLFTPSIEFSVEAEQTARRVISRGREYVFLSAEAIALFKLMYFRGKDRVDLERLIPAYPPLDRDYIRTHLVEWFGADDERVRFWDAQVALFLP